MTFYWEVQHYWGGKVPELSGQNMWELPMWYLLQAHEQGEKLYWRDKHHQEMPIAALHATFFNANIDQKKTDPVDLYQRCLFEKLWKRDLKPKYALDACVTVMELIAQFILPPWAFRQLPMKDIRRISEDAEIEPVTPMAWCGSQNAEAFLILICPRVIAGEYLEGVFSVVSYAHGPVDLYDVETGEYMGTALVENPEKREFFDYREKFPIAVEVKQNGRNN